MIRKLLVQTDRIVRAMENTHVSILAQPTGRLIGEREPYDLDMDRILTAARDTGCFLEINAEPDRLDLNDTYAHAAKSKGVKVAISTDAHSVNAFRYVKHRDMHAIWMLGRMPIQHFRQCFDLGGRPHLGNTAATGAVGTEAEAGRRD